MRFGKRRAHGRRRYARSRNMTTCRMNCDYRINETRRLLSKMGHQLSSSKAVTRVDGITIRFCADLVLIQGERTSATVIREKVTVNGSLTTPEGRLIQRIVDVVIAASPDRNKAQIISKRRVAGYVSEVIGW